MNDLELIQHWAIRGLIIWLTVAAIFSGLGAIFCAVCGWFFPEMFAPAAVLVALMLLCWWRLRRLWRRLNHLEQFIR